MLSLYTLTSCGNTPASEEQINEFYEIKEENLKYIAWDTVSLSYNYEKTTNINNENSKTYSSGYMHHNYNKLEEWQMYTKTITTDGRNINSKDYNEYIIREARVVGRKEYTYIKTINKIDDNEEIIEERYINFAYPNDLGHMINFIQIISRMQKDNKYYNYTAYIRRNKIIYMFTDEEYNCKLTLKFKGDDLSSLEYIKETLNSNLKLTIKIEDVNEVTLPDDIELYIIGK
jgi:hypothetical protein